MFKIKFWPITAKPITAISPCGSDMLFFLFIRHSRAGGNPESYALRKVLLLDSSLRGNDAILNFYR
jgi:hypothetical protein